MKQLTICELVRKCGLKICKIKKENGTVKVSNFKCEKKNNKNKIHDIKNLHKKIRSRRRFPNEEYSTIWIMVWKEDNNSIIQIGQNKSLENLFNEDLRKDINALINFKSANPGRKTKKYWEFSKKHSEYTVKIYEVNIDKFLDAAEIGLPIGINKNFSEEMLYYVKSFIVEGAIAKMFSVNQYMWESSNGLDGMYFNL